MKSVRTLAAFTALVFSAPAGAQLTIPSPFRPDSIVVSRVGTTPTALAGTGNPVFLDEYDPGGSLVQTIALPTAPNGVNRRLVVSGDNISEGGLSRSVDGRYLVISGYDAAIPYPSKVSGTSGRTVRRTIGRIDHQANIDTTTALTDFASTGSPRNVVTLNGSEFWMVGSKGGVRYAPLGGTTSTLLNNDAPDPSHLGLFGGWLYVSTDGGPPRIASVGMNLPVTSGQTLNGLPGFPESGSPDGFYLVDLKSSVLGFDTLYVADDTIGLEKFSVVNNVWVSNGIIGQDTDDYRGLTVKMTSSGVVLYSIRKARGTEGGGELVKLTDSSGYNGAFIGTPAVLATAPEGTAFRGVSLAPNVLPDLSVEVSAPTHATTNEPFNYTFTVRNLGNAPATNITVSFNVPSTLVVENGPDADGFTGPGAAGAAPVVEFTNGTLAPGASATLILTCSAPLDGTYLTIPFTPTVDPGGLIEDSNSENKSAFPSVRTVASQDAPAPTVFNWNDGFSGSWSDATKWTNELASGTSPSANGGSNYILNFNASESFSANNDLSSGFVLNQMNFSGSKVIDISGLQFEFAADGATLPAITQGGTVATRISPIIGSSQDLTIAVNGTGPLTLSGGLFGDGSLTKTGSGKLLLTAPTTYAGATIIEGGTLALSDEGGPNKNAIADGSFERPKFGAEGWAYTPSFTGWTMTGTSGVASRYSAFVDETPEGAQVAFLQGEPSSISQTVTITTPGKYTLKFRGANRPGFTANGVKFKIEGNEVTSWDNTHFDTSGFFVEKSQAVNLAAGPYTIELAGWNTAGGDVGTAIDSVSLTGPDGALPYSSTVGLTNVGATLDIGSSELTLANLSGVAGSAIINNGLLVLNNSGFSNFGGVISGTGGLVKGNDGSFTLEGNNTYTGATTVGQGLLVLNAPTLSDTAGVSISINGTLELNFTGTDIVSSLNIDETNYPPGVYDASNLPGRISGTGSIQVVPAALAPDIALETSAGSDITSGSSQDFGILEIGTPGDNTKVFSVRNKGTSDLVIDPFGLGISGPNGGEFEVSWSGFIDNFYDLSLPPGERAFLIVRFNPDGPGRLTAQLSVPSNDPDENPFVLSLTGSSPQVPVFTTQPDGFTIAHNSAVAWNVAASGVPAPEYQWYIGESGDTSKPVSGATSFHYQTPVLTSSTSYWVRATNSQGSADSDTAIITVNPPSQAEIVVSEAVGSEFTTLTSGDTLDFGNGILGNLILPKAINVGNLGSEILEVPQIIITGPDAADFGVDLSFFPFTVGSGQSEFFTVYLIPGTEGPRTATLTIYSNDADENPVTLALTGNGIVPAPLATTNPATGVTDAAANLRGTVNPKGTATTAAFEFGTTTAYGTTLPVSLSPDNDSNNQNITAFLSSLTTGETYHFRVVATNAWGTTYGADQSFVARTGTDDFTYTISDNQIVITGYTGPGGNVVIPATIEGLPVVSIGNGAFSSNAAITSVVIPEGVFSISQNAFSYCSGLTSVTIPATVNFIGSAAFRGCSAVTSLFIPYSVTYIDLFAFDFMTSLPGFTVDADNPNFSSLDGVLFNKTQTALLVYPAGKTGSYTAPGTVTQIREYAFYFCSNLTGITLPEGLLSIGYGSFEQCDGLTSITIPSTVSQIQPGSISDCNNLTAITVAEPNAYYTSQNGVLFNDDFTELIQYPAGKSGFYTVPSTVTSIAAVAFINADGLTGITLPDGLISLGSGAFYSCVSLTAISIPGGVTSIGPTTFTYCDNLATVILSEGLVSIGNAAFEGCYALTSIVIPSTVTSIGDSAFQICVNLTNAVFLGEAPAMGTNVFQYVGSGFIVGYFNSNSAGFTAPTWPDYPVTNLGTPAPEIKVFEPVGSELASGGNRNFGTSPIEGGGITKTFVVRNAGYEVLENLAVSVGGANSADFVPNLDVFPTSLAIGASADFSVTFHPGASGPRDAVLSIESNDSDENPFTVNLSGAGAQPPFTYTKNDDQLTITGYTGPGGAVVVPATIGGLPVVAIGDYAFFDKDDITSIILPEGIVSIGLQAFLSCDGLTAFTLPDSLLSIGQYAFAYCPNIQEITIPANVSSIEILAFAAMNGLTQFIVDPLNTNFSTINGVLFNADQTTLVQYPGGLYGPYTLPAGVTRIGSFSFYQTTGLTDIIISEEVTSIGFGAFERCDGLTTVTIPSTVASIERAAFSHCSGLLAIDVNELNGNYESLEGVLFDEDLITLIQYPAGRMDVGYEIPATVETIAQSSFSGASSLIGVTMPAGLTTIESQAFYDCGGLESMVIPEGVTIIRGVTFAYCYNLASVTLPDELNTIEDNAFLDCNSLVSIIIPASVTQIQSRAFYSCGKLETATFLGVAPTMGNGVFDAAGEGFFVGYFDPYEAGFVAPSWPGYRVANLGIPAPEIRVVAGGENLVGGDDLVFGNLLAGSLLGETKILTIHNAGNVALTDFAMIIVGQNPADFSVNTSSLPASLPPGGSGQISITFTPIATGARLAALIIESNDLATNTFNLDLSGTGTSSVPFNYRIVSGEIYITGYTGPNGAVVVPNTIAGRPVVGIDEAAFNAKSALTSILLPDGIRIIGPSAFGGCSALTTFTIPTSVTYIGSNAFSGCDNITQLGIPASVTTIETGAFNFMRSITQFTVDPLNTNYSSIGGVLFNLSRTVLLQYPGGRSGLYSLPAGVTRIERSAFSNAEGLTGITLTADLVNIGAYAFGNTGLTNVGVSANVAVIGAGAFSNCGNLTSIDVVPLNGNFEGVGGTLFNEDQSTLIQYPAGKVATSYTVPSSVMAISESAFFGDRNLIGVVMQPGVLTIGSFAFYDCRALESVVVPASVTRINIQTFAYCHALDSVTLSEGLINLGPYAFLSCSSLMNITIPGSVTTIEYNAFLGCGRLETATFLGNAPVMGAGVFDGTEELFYVGYYNPYGAGFLAPSWPGYPVVNLGAPPAPPGAKLANLQVSTGALTPAFAPAVTAYSLSVPASVAEITLTPTPANSAATIRINGLAVAPGTPSAPFSLLAGNNLITTVVTAEDGATTKTYTLIVTRAPSPMVTTQPAEFGGNRTILLKGTIIPNGVATVYFEYGAGSVSENQTQRKILQGNSSQAFDASLSGLPFGTAFRYRAVATGTFGTLYGSEESFTTLQEPPVAATGDPYAVSGSAATLVGAVDPRGLPTEVRFEYGLTASYGKKTESRTITTAGGFQDFLSPSGGLIPDAVYHYRIVATNAAGTSYGDDVTFRVAVGSGVSNPIPTTPPATTTGGSVAVTSISAVLSGAVNPNRGTTVVQFQYGPTASYGRVTSVQGVGNGTEPVDVSLAAGGLLPGTIYHYRLIASNSAGASLGEDATFTTSPAPPSAVTGSAEILSTTRVFITGSATSGESAADVFIDFGIDPFVLSSSIRTTPGTVGGSTATPVSAALENLRQGRTYFYRVRAVGPGSVTGVGETKSFQVGLLSGLIQQFPDSVPLAERQGALDVIIAPSLPAAGWRFLGEKPWRASGSPATGLTTGDRVIEFRPVPGYIQPANETVAIVSTGTVSTFSRSYTSSGDAGSGAVNVTLRPEGITADTRPFESMAKWALFGEVDGSGEPVWQDSGSSKSGLIPGNHVIIAKPVIGRGTPLPITVRVRDGEVASATITYFVAEDGVGTPPEVIDFGSVSSAADRPYAFVGQFRSDAGAGSGFVVRPGVVATAAHVLFDDGTLSSATHMQWLHRHDEQLHDPVPLIPRGYFLLTGYAAQRAVDNSPGTSTPESQNLDAAAAYFLSDPGKGGFSGYLASDSIGNEFLLSSAQKTLVGYPVDGTPEANLNRMHHSQPGNITFTRGFKQTYVTPDIRSSGGGSGGPLCVQYEYGNYYPAAIYLGGTAQTVVRAIDSTVTDLIGFAEASATVNAGKTGGEITLADNVAIEDSAESALEVAIEPAAARAAGAGWRIQASSPYLNSGSILSDLTPNTYTVRFPDIPGFVPPAPQPVEILAGFRKRITFTYEVIILPPVVVPQDGVTCTRGNPFSYQISASNSPSAFSLLGGLPDGLEFDSNSGQISGTPEEAGVFELLIGASNSGGSDSKPLRITSLPALGNQALVVPFNQLVNYAIVSSESGEGVIFSTAPLPKGLSLNPATGVISGISQQPGTFPVEIRVTRRGATASAELRLDFTDTAPVITSHSGLARTVPYGGETTLSVIATGSPDPIYQWYRGSTGITGQPFDGADKTYFTTPPLSGQTEFWVRVSNNSGFSDSETFTVSVLPSSNANLSNLVPNAGTLSPSFNAGIASYSVFVPNETTALSFTAFAEVPQTRVSINTSPVALETASAPINLIVGQNTIVVRATAGDGITTRSHTVIVTRGAAPTVQTGIANNITDSTALLNGTATPNGKATVFFQYGTSPAYGDATPGREISGNAAVAVDVPLFGLQPETTYHFRIGITTGAGTIYGADAVFATAEAPPLVATGDATDVGTSKVKLIGAVDSNGNATTVYFEWGETILYGNRTPDQLVPAGTNVTDIQFTANGLVPGNTYNYRLVATNSTGTSYGDNVTFTAGQANGGTGSPLQVPEATTSGVADVTSSSAVLLGTADPNGGTTFVRFEYGLTAAYGSSSPTRSIGNGTDSAAVVIPIAGLLPGEIYHYRLVATNSLGTARGEDTTFNTGFPPPLATTGSASPLSPASARLLGSVKARGASAEVFFEYGTDGVDFPNRILATPGSVGGNLETPVSADLSNLDDRVKYFYRLTATRTGNPSSATIGETKTLEADALYGLVQKFSREVPVASRDNVLTIQLAPAGIGAWRFVGENDWRPSGIPVGGLTSGDRLVEYLPVAGYIQPPREQVGIVSGEVPQVIDRTYYQTLEPGSAALRVVLAPQSISGTSVPLASRAQWRLTGETAWRNSGDEVGGLPPGNYLVECKAVPGRNTPPGASAELIDGPARMVTVTYPPANAPNLSPPVAVPFNTASNSRNFPYAYVGQFRTDAGSQTGFVVKPRVVATTSLAIFNDSTLTRNTGMQWLLQRDSGTYEPTPQVPRGSYVFTGYEAQRLAEGTPGTLSLQSQNLNVAALYFAADAGRGGFSGYLASDNQANEFLQSAAMKTLVGYPVNGIAEAAHGRMHATPTSAASFGWELGRTYSSSAIRGLGGMEGGPLCVRFQQGAYYPAAIYLGGTSKSIVRAIDGPVIDMFSRAELSGNGGDNNTGGGITHSSFTSIGATTAGALKVIIEPAAARDALAGWRLNPETSYRISGGQKSGLAGGKYVLEMKTVAGFDPPASAAVTVTGGQLREVTYTYQEANVAPTVGNVANLSTNEDTSIGPIAVTLFDADNAENALVLTCTSSNTTVIPNANIALGGSGANRTVSVSPALHQSGTAILTLTVSDGKLTDIDNFTVTVNAVNDPPTISLIPNQTLPVGSATSAIPFVVGDIETSPASLTLSATSTNTALVPVSNIVFGGSGANRTITVSPAAGQIGTSSITVAVSDGGLSSSRTFTLTVNGSSVDAWRLANFNTNSNSGDAADGADPDGDGQTNTDEYAAGTDPKSSADVFKVSSTSRSGSVFSVVVPIKAGRSYSLQRRADLDSGAWLTVISTGVQASDGVQTLTDPDASGNRGFYRVVVGFSSP